MYFMFMPWTLKRERDATKAEGLLFSSPVQYA